MQNIGDRLTEARKRLGLDLRQASEATKIRTDYLIAMEDGSFDFSLPEVYKKGFLKIYARYLKLDPEKMASDFIAQFSTSAHSATRREGPDNLGRVEAPGGFGPGAASAFENLAADQAARAEKNAAMVRLGVIISVAVIFIVLIIMLLQHMLQGSATPAETKSADTAAAASNTPATPPANTPAPTTPAVVTPTPPPANGMMQFTFHASGNIAKLTVWQLSDQRQLSTAALAKDKTLTISSRGPVEVVASETQYLTIQINGGPAQSIFKDGKLAMGSVPFVWPQP